MLVRAAWLLLGLVALPTAAPLRVAPGVKTIQRVRGKVGVTLCESSNYPGGLGNERAQLAKVSSLWPDTTGSVSASLSAQEKLWLTTGRDPRMKVSGLQSEEPSFTRIFTHATWSRYTGRQPLIRWLTISSTWRFSTILYAVAPIAALSSLWAFIIARLPAVLLPRTSPVPMSLMGTALGLLLVFRTNNSYLRLMEARTHWSNIISITRDIGQLLSTALLTDTSLPKPEKARVAAFRCCRYLAAFTWELRNKLTGGEVAEDLSVLRALLPEEEANWIGAQRSRPLQALASLRREVHAQFRNGNLPTHLHRRLEEDIHELNMIVGHCERLFGSPLPPTMCRHIVRCLQIWLFGFPFVLAGTMAPASVAAWVFGTSYAFVGIDEIGVQVEQSFDIIPMTRLCQIVNSNLEECFVNLPPYVLQPKSALND